MLLHAHEHELVSFLDAVGVDAADSYEKANREHDNYRRKNESVVRQVSRNPEVAVCVRRMRSNPADVVEPITSKTTQSDQLSNASPEKAQIELVSSNYTEEDRQQVRSLLRFPRCAALWIRPIWVALAER